MKQPIFSIKSFFIFLLLGSPDFACSQSERPQKGAAIIVIHADTTGIYSKVINVLYDNRYNIEKKDEVHGLISSTEKSLNSFSIKLRFRLRDSLIFVTGTMAPNISLELYGIKTERSFDQISYSGMKGSMIRNAWNEMNLIASKIGTILRYQK